MHKTTNTYKILFFLKLIVLSFIFCLPKAELITLEKPNFYKIEKTEASAALVINHSQIESKATKKSGQHLDFFFPTLALHFFSSSLNSVTHLFINNSLTSHHASGVNARAPPALS